MKRYLFLMILLIFLVVVLLPAAALRLSRSFSGGVKVEVSGPTVRVLVHQTGRTEEMVLDEYLVGVLAAEMPADFELEALKAQAVAGRTYALKKMLASAQTPNPHHPGADVCTDPAHCQGWLSKDEMVKRWGLVAYFNNSAKLGQAVESTKGLVATYQGQIIDPVYHSNSGGRTENSEDVWQQKIPYLRGVNSPWDRQAPRWQEVVAFPLSELDRRLGTALTAKPAAKITSASLPAIKIVSATQSGRVKEIKVGGKSFTGNEFRRLLGLNSSALTWEKRGDRIILTVNGYGHGVGLSQYGANGMAKEGKDYRQILSYYYTGITLASVGR